MGNCTTCKNAGRPSYIDPCASCGGDPDNRTKYDPSPSILGKEFGEKMAEAFLAGLDDRTWPDAIEAADAARPNTVSYLRKIGWLSALDRSLLDHDFWMVADKRRGEVAFDMGPDNRRELYTEYCLLRISLEQDDLASYNEHAAEFNSMLRRFWKV